MISKAKDFSATKCSSKSNTMCRTIYFNKHSKFFRKNDYELWTSRSFCLSSNKTLLNATSRIFNGKTSVVKIFWTSVKG